MMEKLHDEWMDEKFKTIQKACFVKANFSMSKSIRFLILTWKINYNFIEELEPFSKRNYASFFQRTSFF